MPVPSRRLLCLIDYSAVSHMPGQVLCYSGGFCDPATDSVNRQPLLLVFFPFFELFGVADAGGVGSDVRMIFSRTQ